MLECLGDGYGILREIKVFCGQSEGFTFAKSAPVKHLEIVVTDRFVHHVFGELQILLTSPEFHLDTFISDVYEYYKGLIAFRKAHPALRLTTSSDCNSTIFQIPNLPANVVGYKIHGGINGESSDGIVAIFNANNAFTTVTLPEGNWNVYVNGEKAGTAVLDTVSGTVSVDPISAMILVKGSLPPEDDTPAVDDPTIPTESTPVETDPVETKPVETKPVETVPTEPETDKNPTQATRPTEDQTAPDDSEKESKEKPVLGALERWLILGAIVFGILGTATLVYLILRKK